MPPATKIILHVPRGVPQTLDAAVERWLADGVRFIAVVGPDASLIEDMIDEIVVGDGSRVPVSLLLTSSHPDETFAEVIEFANSLTGKFSGESIVVELQ